MGGAVLRPSEGHRREHGGHGQAAQRNCAFMAGWSLVRNDARETRCRQPSAHELNRADQLTEVRAGAPREPAAVALAARPGRIAVTPMIGTRRSVHARRAPRSRPCAACANPSIPVERLRLRLQRRPRAIVSDRDRHSRHLESLPTARRIPGSSSACGTRGPSVVRATNGRQ